MIIGKKIIHIREVDSTNEEARRQVEQGAGEGLVVMADFQSKGKGKPGNTWFSPRGKGLYFSAVLKPFRNPADLVPLTLLGAKAVVAAIRKIADLPAEIKLPNDVLINGKKVSGVLVERTASGFLIVGVGVNINNDSFPEDLAFSATSLKIEKGCSFDISKFAEVLMSELEREYLAYLEEV